MTTELPVYLCTSRSAEVQKCRSAEMQSIQYIQRCRSAERRQHTNTVRLCGTVNYMNNQRRYVDVRYTRKLPYIPLLCIYWYAPSPRREESYNKKLYKYNKVREATSQV